MQARRTNSGLLVFVLTVAVGCAQANNQAGAEFTPVYNGIERIMLDVDLVNMRVSMSGARDRQDVAQYARCAVAQYALNRGYGFARQVRTNVSLQAGIWSADAVYTISPTLPQGLRTLDAEVVVQNCMAEGIPAV
ncbi:MAG: hypothetical protein ACC619_07725 [Paracoccaceae bacterium]